MREAIGQRLEKIFELMDSDGNGHIDEQEGLAIARALGDKDPQKWWESLLKHVDVDGSGTIEQEEYVSFMVAAYQGAEVSAATEELERMFTKLDEGLARKALQSPRGAHAEQSYRVAQQASSTS